jgi:hypothetical protein
VNYLERHKLLFILLMMLLQVVALAVIGYNTALSVTDRKQLHKEFEILQQKAEFNRAMLDARARIQIANTKANWHKLSAEEKRFIQEQWDVAEYNLIQPFPFK